MPATKTQSCARLNMPCNTDSMGLKTPKQLARMIAGPPERTWIPLKQRRPRHNQKVVVLAADDPSTLLSLATFFDSKASARACRQFLEKYPCKMRVPWRHQLAFNCADGKRREMSFFTHWAPLPKLTRQLREQMRKAMLIK